MHILKIDFNPPPNTFAIPSNKCTYNNVAKKTKGVEIIIVLAISNKVISILNIHITPLYGALFMEWSYGAKWRSHAKTERSKKCPYDSLVIRFHVCF